MKTRTPTRRETNRNRLSIARLAICLFCLVFSFRSIAALPADGSHQTPSQTGQNLDHISVDVCETCQLLACNILIGNSSYFPGFSVCELPHSYGLDAVITFTAQRILLGTRSSNTVVSIKGDIFVTGSVYYANKVELARIISSYRHEIEPGASLMIHAPVNIDTNTSFVFRTPEGVSAHQGMGRIRISGALGTNTATGQIDILGAITQLPVTLITATAITGNWRAGVLPPGTQLLFRPQAISLIRRVRK